MSRRSVSSRKRLELETLEGRLCLSTLPPSAMLAHPDAASPSRLSAAYGQLPLSFEANQGQTDSHVNFLSRGAGYSLFLSPTKAVLSFKQGNTSNVVSMRVVAANPTSHAVGLDRQAGVSNYFIGNDPSKWHTNVPNYTKVDYHGVYRGIDLVYHGSQKQLEYDFVVAPGADAQAIRLAFDGARSVSLDHAGNLVLHTTGGVVIEHAPVVYQVVNGHQQAVAARYVIQGNHHQVGFKVGRYDRSKPLVIDPVLSYSTYLGGSQDDFGYAIAVDGSGNAYVTGQTSSSNFPKKNPLQSRLAGSADVFVTKLNPEGTALIYSTFLGGSGNDRGTGIAVDPTGNAFLTGRTTSTNFPTRNAAQPSHGGGTFDAFVTELNPAGSALVYSTYLGGSGSESPDVNQGGIALFMDASGHTFAYVAGATTSTNFATTPGAYQTTFTGTKDAFVTKYGPTGAVVYSSYLGGSDIVLASGIAVDTAGNAYLTGYTNNLPTTPGAFQTTIAIADTDAFVTKFDTTGSGLAYSTYLGGSDNDAGIAIAVDGAGNAFITGDTASTNFPTKNPFQANNAAKPGGNKNVFVTKLNSTGASLLYSTYLGGSGGNDQGKAIAVDSAGMIYVTGYTQSSGFPVLNAFQPTPSAFQSPAFVTKLNPNLSGSGSLVYSSFLGGGNEDGRGIAAFTDVYGNTYAFVTGDTASTNFPTKNPFQAQLGGKSHTWDAFVTKIAGN